nr:hypothetical protein [Pseudomonadota bacterium]
MSLFRQNLVNNQEAAIPPPNPQNVGLALPARELQERQAELLKKTNNIIRETAAAYAAIEPKEADLIAAHQKVVQHIFDGKKLGLDLTPKINADLKKEYSKLYFQNLESLQSEEIYYAAKKEGDFDKNHYDKLVKHRRDYSSNNLIELEARPFDILLTTDKNEIALENKVVEAIKTAKELNYFVKHWNWDSSEAVEMLAKLDQKQIEYLSYYYQKEYGRNLKQDYKAELSAVDFQRFTHLLNGEKSKYLADTAWQAFNAGDTAAKIEELISQIPDNKSEREMFLQEFNKISKASFKEILKQQNYQQATLNIIDYYLLQEDRADSSTLAASKLFLMINRDGANEKNIWKYFENIRQEQGENSSEFIEAIKIKFDVLAQNQNYESFEDILGNKFPNLARYFSHLSDTSEVRFSTAKLFLAIALKDKELIKETFATEESNLEAQAKQQNLNSQLLAVLKANNFDIFNFYRSNFNEIDNLLLLYYADRGTSNQTTELLEHFNNPDIEAGNREIIKVLKSNSKEQLENMSKIIDSLLWSSKTYPRANLYDLVKSRQTGFYNLDLELALEGKPSDNKEIFRQAYERFSREVPFFDYAVEHQKFDQSFNRLVSIAGNDSENVTQADSRSRIAYAEFNLEGDFYRREKQERANLLAYSTSMIAVTGVTIATSGTGIPLIVALISYGSADLAANAFSKRIVQGQEYDLTAMKYDLYNAIGNASGYAFGGKLSRTFFNKIIGADKLEQLAVDAIRRRLGAQLLENTLENTIGGSIATAITESKMFFSDTVELNQENITTYLKSIAMSAGVNAG